MDSSTFVLLSGALTFGAPLVLAVRELVVLRRDRGDGGWSGEWRRSEVVPPPGPRGGGQALPACLIEAARGDPVAGREAVRELETA